MGFKKVIISAIFSTLCFGACAESTQSGLITPAQGRKIIGYTLQQCDNMWFLKPVYAGPRCPDDPPSKPDDSNPDYCVKCQKNGKNFGGEEVDTKPITCAQSYIDNIFANHHHISTDYKIGSVGNNGCSSCGASLQYHSGLDDLAIFRHHRYRESSRGGSFGPGVFVNYDTQLTLYTDSGSNVIEWFDPEDLAARKFVDGANGDTKDGVYVDQINKIAKEIRLYNASNQLTTDITTASSAILTYHTGQKQYFNIVNVGSGASSQAVDGAAPWRHIDIGRVARTGTTTVAGSTLTLTASGRDIYNQQDEAQFAFQALRGDGSIVAHVSSLTNTDPNAKAAVMLRESLADGSRFAAMAATPGNGFQFERRKTAYTNVTATNATLFQPKWVRIVRAGDIFTSYQSTDGITWSQVGQTSITMAPSTYIGLCVTSHNNTILNTSTFDNISTSTGNSPPWQEADIGTVGIAGSSNLAGSVYTVSGSGSDIWNSADSFHFVYQQLTGDGQITAQVATVQNTDPWAKAGVMIRETLSANSVHATTVNTPLNGVVFQRRTATSGVSATTSTPLGSGVPGWVRLTRSGNTLTGAISADGVTWNNVGSDTISFGTDLFVGFALTSHHDGLITTGVFDNVAINGTPTPAGQWPAENIQSSYVGRITRIEDRNGYGTNITYKSFTAAEINESPTRQLQISNVTDAYGRSATFTYNSQQQSGLWVISKIDLPNSQNIQYQYSDGKLSAVSLPDGTQSTFTYGVDTDSQCTTVAYNDVAADGTHRRKTAYLTNNIFINSLTEDTAQAINQSSLLIRMVVNGSDEVSYLNTPNPHHSSNNENLIYEGAGKIRALHGTWTSMYYKDGWQFTNPDAGYDGLSGTRESNYASTPVDHNALQKGTWTSITDIHGVTCTFQYDNETFPIQKAYPDGTTEQWQYNNLKLVTRYKDRLNRVTRWSYDANGNILTKEVGILFDGLNDVNQSEYAIYRWEYYPAGDANQFLLKTAFDSLYNPNQPDMHRTDYVYNNNHLLITRIEGADVAGGDRAQINFSYDSVGRIQTSSDALGRTMTFTYDERDRLIKIIYSDTSTEQFIYGQGVDANLLLKQKDRNGNVTKFEYDNSGRRTKTITAYAKMDQNGNETLITDPLVRVEESCTYLAGTELKTSCLKGGDLTEYVYDYRQRVKSVTVHPRTGTLLTTTNTYSKNLLFSVQDPYGRKTYNNYRSSDSALIRIIRGTVPSFSLADFNAVIAKTRDLSNNASYVIDDLELDAERQTIARLDGRNIRHTMSYDSRGRLIETVEAESVGGVATTVQAKTQFEYDANSNRTLIKHPRTFTENSNFYTEFTYNGRNLLSSQTEAAGKPEAATMSYTYFLDKRLKDTTDRRNFVWSQTYKECCGRLATKADPILSATGRQPVTYFGYDFFGNTTHTARLSDVSGVTDCCTGSLDSTKVLNETTTKFDARNRPIAQTVWLDALSGVDENNPPIFGDPGAPAGKTGLTTKWRYDDNLADSVGIDADYSTQLMGLSLGANNDGYAVEVTNPAGEKTVTVYDGTGRVIRTIDGNLNKFTTTYDAVVNNLVEIAVADGLNHTTKSRADGIGRVRETVDAETRLTTYGYDANSNRVTFRDPNSTGQDCVFDERNRDVQCSDTAATPSVTKKTYDAANNVVKTTDALNKDTICVFDARNRKVSCTDRISGLTTYEYDKNSNLTKIVDADANAGTTGKSTNYSYDPRNLLTFESFPEHNLPTRNDSRTYGYDGANRLVSRLDQNNDTTMYTYDMANRLLTRAYPDNLNDTFGYDAASRLTSASCARYNNSVVRVYDAGSRLISENQVIDSTSYVIQYAYDAANRQTTVTYPDGSVVTRAFTDRNQLQNVKLAGVNVATFSYDNGMRRTSTTFGNGLVESRTYRTDNLNNTISIPGVTNFTYSWDANKRKTAEADGIVPPVNSQTFGYDDENRLTSFNRQNGDTQSWNLSLIGDWNSFTNNGNAETRVHNGVHELTSINSAPLNYDPKGNLATNTNGQQYQWDFENRMKQATIPANPNPIVATYAFDALGRRVSKSVGGATTVFVNDGLQEIAEYDNGTLAQKYVFGTYIDEPLLMQAGSTKTYFHLNQLYSTAALTDAAGAVVERYTYSPYGAVKILGSDGVTVRITSAVGNPWTFTGRRRDSESELLFYRTRLFDCRLGRFLNRMPWHSMNSRLSRVNFLPLPDVMAHWFFGNYAAAVLKNARGSYIQNRFNQYEYMRNSPARFVEPFSCGWGTFPPVHIPQRSDPPQGFSVVWGSATEQGDGSTEKATTGTTGVVSGLSASCGLTHTAIAYNNTVYYDGSWGDKFCPRQASYSRDPISQCTSGTLKFGTAKGKNCKNVTSAEIIDCLESRAPNQGQYHGEDTNWPKGYNFISYNCHHDVEDAMKDCCLCGWKSYLPKRDPPSTNGPGSASDPRYPSFGDIWNMLGE